MNAHLRELLQNKIKPLAQSVNEPGKRLVFKKLVESADPWETIINIQEEFSLGHQSFGPAISFLDILQASRQSTFETLLENLKLVLCNEMMKLDATKLLNLLQISIQFLSVRELRSIPIEIIKRLPKVPEKYLNYLSTSELSSDFPLSIRQQIWENNKDLFIKSICNHCEASFKFINSSNLDDKKSLTSSLKPIFDCIGDSEILFSYFADYCCRMNTNSLRTFWSRLLRISIVEKQNRIPMIKTLGDLAGLINAAIREKKVDFKFLKELIANITSIWISLGSRAQSQLADVNNDPFSNSKKSILLVMLDAWNYISSLDEHKIFAEKITDEIVPHYSEYIAKPMDLSTIKQNIMNRKYHQWKDFNDDVRLIFRNCRTFNGNDSEYTRIGNRIEKKWKAYVKKVSRDVIFDDLVILENEANTTTISAPRILLKLSNQEIESKSEDVKVETGEQHLRFKFKISEKSKESFTEPTKSDSLPVVKEENLAAPKLIIPNQKKRKLQDTDIEDPPIKSPEVKDEIISKQVLIKEDIASKLLDLPSDKKVQKLLDIVWEYLLSLDTQGYFASPVDKEMYPDYYQFIATPIDLMIIRIKMDRELYVNLSDVCHDIRLMLDNCRSYNEPNSYICRDATACLKAWNESYEILSSFIDAKDILIPNDQQYDENDLFGSDSDEELPENNSELIQQTSLRESNTTTKNETSANDQPNIVKAVTKATNDSKTINAKASISTKDIINVKSQNTINSKSKSLQITKENSLAMIAATDILRMRLKENALIDAFPSIRLEATLLWALNLLADTDVFLLLVSLLAKALKQFVEDASNVSAMIEVERCLPHMDKRIKVLTQICQLSLTAEYNLLPNADIHLLRKIYPLLLSKMLEEVNGKDTILPSDISEWFPNLKVSSEDKTLPNMKIFLQKLCLHLKLN